MDFIEFLPNKFVFPMLNLKLMIRVPFGETIPLNTSSTALFVIFRVVLPIYLSFPISAIEIQGKPS